MPSMLSTNFYYLIVHHQGMVIIFSGTLIRMVMVCKDGCCQFIWLEQNKMQQILVLKPFYITTILSYDKLLLQCNLHTIQYYSDSCGGTFAHAVQNSLALNNYCTHTFCDEHSYFTL